MGINETLGRFVLSRHVPMRDVVFNGAEQKFITCFDTNGDEVSIDEVQKVSPGGKQGELDYFTPTPGIGYYAHLRLAGESAGQQGGSTRYEIAAPDWKTVAHVTEPAAGGAPDVIVEEFDVTPSAEEFARAVASGL